MSIFGGFCVNAISTEFGPIHVFQIVLNIHSTLLKSKPTIPQLPYFQAFIIFLTKFEAVHEFIIKGSYCSKAYFRYSC